MSYFQEKGNDMKTTKYTRRYDLVAVAIIGFLALFLVVCGGLLISIGVQYHISPTEELPATGMFFEGWKPGETTPPDCTDQTMFRMNSLVNKPRTM